MPYVMVRIEQAVTVISANDEYTVERYLFPIKLSRLIDMLCNRLQIKHTRPEFNTYEE